MAERPVAVIGLCYYSWHYQGIPKQGRYKGYEFGVYIKENVNYISAVENAHPEHRHLWREVPGRNKHSKALVSVIYNSELMLCSALKVGWIV